MRILSAMDAAMGGCDPAAQLEALDEAARDLASALAPDVVLQRITDRARELVCARYAALGVFDERGHIRQFITSGISEQERAAIGALPRGRGLLGALLKEGTPIRRRDLSQDARSVGFPPRHPPMRSFLGVPIVLHSHNVGNLYLTEKEGAEEFGVEDEALIVRLARHAAIAIERAQLYEAAQAERRRLQTILDTLPDGVILADARRGGAIVMFNAAAVQLWGAPPVPMPEPPLGDARGQMTLGAAALAAYVRPPGARFSLPDGTEIGVEDLPSSRALRGEPVLGMEITIEQPSGQRVPTIASAAPLYDAEGRLTGAVSAFQDVTPVKEAERVKREFLSLVTHELRTPLTGIKGIVSGLLAEDVTLDPQEARELLGLVDEAADHLSGLVTNLLDMSRLEAGALDLEPESFHAGDVVAAAVREVAGVLRQHRLRQEIPANLPEVWADYAQTKRVLVNLLANAAKYAPEGTLVTVSAQVQPAGGGQSGQEVVLSVRDQGPGITAEELPRIFDRFSRGGGRPVRGQAGTGLGLAIAKGLVEAMGGRIWVGSRPGRGATFSFALPAP